MVSRLTLNPSGVRKQSGVQAFVSLSTTFPMFTTLSFFAHPSQNTYPIKDYLSIIIINFYNCANDG